MTGRRDQARDMEAARAIARQAAALGGRAYYVGGFVRDRLLGRENTDVDIEVHGLTPSQLEEILDGLGGRLEMGASFGIYGLKGYGLDIAMPRRERAIGRGHRDFDVTVDPFLGTEQAAPAAGLRHQRPDGGRADGPGAGPFPRCPGPAPGRAAACG